MYQNFSHLFRTRKFTPFFATQFLSAFNDNLFKFALVLFLKFQMDDLSGEETAQLTTIAAGLFILPFFLFSALAGQLADKYEKSYLIRIIRFAEIPLMILAAIGFYLESATFLLGVLFLMGTKSAFFGPLKYSLLPEHLKKSELIGANGLVEMATFVSILVGTILGGELIRGVDGRLQVAAFTIFLAFLGYFASWYIPKTIPKTPTLKINFNFLAEGFIIMKEAYSNQKILISILGISWFWLVGATFLAQFPNYTKDIVLGDERIATLFLFSLSVGIGVGSVLCNRVLKSKISARLAPWATLIMGVFCVDIYFSSPNQISGQVTELMTLGQFLADPWNWRILFNFIMIALAGGFYIVPFYTILQTRSSDKSRSRMIAANNITNSLFMVLSSLIALALLGAGFIVTEVFLLLGVVTIGIAGIFYFKRGWEGK